MKKEEGTVITFSALCIAMLMLIVGISIELSRMLHVKAAIVSAAEVALISASKLFVTDCVANGTHYSLCICPTGGLPLNTPTDIVAPEFRKTYNLVFRLNTPKKEYDYDETKVKLTMDCHHEPTLIQYNFQASAEAEIHSMFLRLFGWNDFKIPYKVTASRED